MTMIRILHNQENPFVQLNKKALWDPNLSLAAIGLWARLLSRPDDWQLSATELSKSCNLNIKTIYAYLDELIENGYATRFQNIEDGKKKNQFAKMEYVIFEFKISGEELKKCFPQSTFRRAEVRRAEKRYATNKEFTNKEEQQTQQAPSEVCPAGGVSPAAGVSFCLEREGKLAALAKFRLPKKVLEQLLKFSLDQIQDGILAFEQFCHKKKPDNPLGLLQSAIKNNWKPNDAKETKHEEFKKNIEENRSLTVAMIKRFEYKFSKTFKITDRMKHAELHMTNNRIAVLDYSDPDCIHVLNHYININKE